MAKAFLCTAKERLRVKDDDRRGPKNTKEIRGIDSTIPPRPIKTQQSCENSRTAPPAFKACTPGGLTHAFHFSPNVNAHASTSLASLQRPTQTIAGEERKWYQYFLQIIKLFL